MTREQVLHFARLARLKLEEDEVARVTEQLASIVAYVDLLGEAEIDDPPGDIGAERATPLRDDVPAASLERSEALGQSARADDEGFVLPSFGEG